jgi:hypothetical protein
MLTLIGDFCGVGFLNSIGFVAGIWRQRPVVPN